MSNQDRYIPGVPCWVDTSQPDPEAAVTFYGELFGWEFEDATPPGAPGRYYIARIRGGDVAAVGSQPQGAPATAVWNTYVWVADADETAARVRAAGGSVLMEPSDVADAGRTAVFTDPAGAAFRVWQANQHRGAAIVNEHASLNFNNLHTRDVDGARDFYRAVFGWALLDAGSAASMWALPAYGDFLEQRTPGLRANIAQMGAPERFEEVVASLTPIADDAAHWGVTFAVDDADAIATRAAELGGQVLVAPFDAPWVRMTIITDPQGATFTASKFVPDNKDLTHTGSAAADA
jgi:predicted enzyme related to lactoylglutathione lyase